MHIELTFAQETQDTEHIPDDLAHLISDEDLDWKQDNMMIAQITHWIECDQGGCTIYSGPFGLKVKESRIEIAQKITDACRPYHGQRFKQQ